ncbi:hypothetical protein [Desulfosporosinus shakirovi]|uniref:hypothetical protein n=1 Tax=Desulfosporosinus shakirovi TaxID=2885154 RepID=UPI001E35D0A2|nr:hypothetical protein [Desulfosporosinus sp. SRJS8]MCB8818630.1 hypothetical protein [Desulfosporosinus sp. SRJS8]
MNKKYFWFIYFLSLFPILSVTDDKNFGDITRETKVFRISLLNLSLGVHSFYLFTFKKDDGFKFFKYLNLTHFSIEESVILEKVENYRKTIAAKQDSDINIHITDLQYKIANQEAIKNGSFNKMVAYNALTLMAVGFAIPYLIKIYKITEHLFFYSLFILIFVYNFANIFAYILEFLKVKIIIRSTFGDLKQSQNPLHEFAASLYLDWYTIKDEARLFVSYVRNIEKYIKIVIFYFVLFICIYNLLAYNANKVLPGINKNASTHLINFSLDNQDVFSSPNLKQLDKVREGLITDKISQILIIKSPSLKGKELDLYQKVFSLFEIYNISHAKIVEVDQTNPRDSNQVSIIILGR